jgi:hypothetical protein
MIYRESLSPNCSSDKAAARQATTKEVQPSISGIRNDGVLIREIGGEKSFRKCVMVASKRESRFFPL